MGQCAKVERKEGGNETIEEAKVVKEQMTKKEVA